MTIQSALAIPALVLASIAFAALCIAAFHFYITNNDDQ